MSQPYTSKIMRLEVYGIVVGTVELVNLEVIHSGNVEGKYGQDVSTPILPWNRHAVGMKRCRFTIRKWYKSDSVNTDLFYTLFDNDIAFILKEYLTGVTGFAGLEITDCEIYHYNPITGNANDISEEEIVGEGLIWMKKINGFPPYPYPPSGYIDLVIDNFVNIDQDLWLLVGAFPYLNTDDTSNYVWSDWTAWNIGYLEYFTFEDLDPSYSWTWSDIHLFARVKQQGGSILRFYLWDGSAYQWITDLNGAIGVWTDIDLGSISGVLDTQTKIDGTYLKLWSNQMHWEYVSKVWLRVYQ